MKIVNYPITVTSGDFCWNYTPTDICGFFDNEGGHSTCELGFDVYDTRKGVRKAKNCRDFKEVSCTSKTTE